jgi:hypothetical protein
MISKIGKLFFFLNPLCYYTFLVQINVDNLQSAQYIWIVWYLDDKIDVFDLFEKFIVEIWSFVTPRHNSWSLCPCDNVVS